MRSAGHTRQPLVEEDLPSPDSLLLLLKTAGTSDRLEIPGLTAVGHKGSVRSSGSFSRPNLNAAQIVPLHKNPPSAVR